MARPGNTKTATVGDGWQRLATLYDSAFSDTIEFGGIRANRLWLSISTQAAKIAYADTMPALATGHPLADGDSLLVDNQDWIKKAWLKNSAAGSAATVIITPIYES